MTIYSLPVVVVDQELVDGDVQCAACRRRMLLGEEMVGVPDGDPAVPGPAHATCTTCVPAGPRHRVTLAPSA